MACWIITNYFDIIRWCLMIFESTCPFYTGCSHMFLWFPMIFPLTGDCSNPPSAAGLFSTDFVRPLPCGIVSWRSAVPHVNVNSPGIHPEILTGGNQDGFKPSWSWWKILWSRLVVSAVISAGSSQRNSSEAARCCPSQWKKKAVHPI